MNDGNNDEFSAAKEAKGGGVDGWRRSKHKEEVC